MAVVLVVAAVIILAVVWMVAALNGAVAFAVLAVAGPALVLLSLFAVAWALRGRLSAWAGHHLVRIAGPAIVEAMLPRDVLDAWLNRVFGTQVPHEEITTALLGGGGREISCRDIAVSRATSVRATLSRINDSTCLTEMMWSHEFAGVRDNHRLVMFGTNSPDIFTLLTSRRVYPLFEAWFVQTEDQLVDFEHNTLKGLEVGISYRDEDGFVHTVDPVPEQGEEVALVDYDKFVRLPERLDPESLVIFQLDLYDLAHPDHIVEAVERLTLRASSVGPFEQGFITWSAPHPCFVDSVVFDVRNLSQAHEKLNYQVIVNTVRISYSAEPVPGVWANVPEGIEVTVRSWMLPGHGVTLLWRLIDGMESLDGAEHR